MKLVSFCSIPQSVKVCLRISKQSVPQILSVFVYCVPLDGLFVMKHSIALWKTITPCCSCGKLLDDFLDSEVRARVNGVASQMKTFDYFFGTYFHYCLLRHTDNLSKTMQQVLQKHSIWLG